MSHRTRRANRPSHIVGTRDIAREREILNAPTQQNDPVIKALLERLPTANDVEAVNIGLALQAYIRGDAALLNNMNDPQVAETVNKIRASRAEQDEAVAAYERDQARFVEDVLNRAEKIAPVGEKRDKAIADGVAEYKRAQDVAKANRVEASLRLMDRVYHDPKVMVDVKPVMETRLVNGTPQVVVLPQYLHIFDKVFELKPGPQLLPKILADRYADIERSQAENEARKKNLAANMNAAKLEQAMRDIDNEYQSNRGRVAVPQEV